MTKTNAKTPATKTNAKTPAKPAPVASKPAPAVLQPPDSAGIVATATTGAAANAKAAKKAETKARRDAMRAALEGIRSVVKPASNGSKSAARREKVAAGKTAKCNKVLALLTTGKVVTKEGKERVLNVAHTLRYAVMAAHLGATAEQLQQTGADARFPWRQVAAQVQAYATAKQADARTVLVGLGC